MINGPNKLYGNECDSLNDHRIAMTLGIAGLLSKNMVTVDGSEVVDISYPDFWRDLEFIAYQ